MAFWNSLGIFAFVTLLLNGCAQVCLEKKYISNLTVEESYSNTSRNIIISGSCNHSALGVSKLIIYESQNSWMLEVSLSMGTPGSFHFDLEVPSYIKSIYLDKDLLWCQNDETCKEKLTNTDNYKYLDKLTPTKNETIMKMIIERRL